MFLLALFVAVAIAVSFLCSIMEAVLLSVTPGHLATMEQSGHPQAKRLRALKSNIDEPLAAILSLNTIAHTVGATGAGAQAARVFDETWLGIFSAVLTLAILFLSEIIPKTVGAVFCVLALMLPPLKPLTWASSLVSGLISKEHSPHAISREEIGALADLGAEQGVLAPEESRIVRAMLRFETLRARDVMTPRTVVFALPEEKTTGEVVSGPRRLRFSRIPIYDESIDYVTGYVLKDEVLERVAKDDFDTPLSSMRRTIMVTPRLATLPDLLERFLRTREHIAVVVDEYGGTEGVVTLEDVVETLLDLEIVDEVDKIDDLRAAAREEWRKRAKRLGLLDEEDRASGERPALGASSPAPSTSSTPTEPSE
jgi:CBS domain containing-hemolysin-like protein